MTLVSLSSNTTGINSGAGTANPSEAPGFSGVHVVGYFLCSILYIIDCPFVLFT